MGSTYPVIGLINGPSMDTSDYLFGQRALLINRLTGLASFDPASLNNRRQNSVDSVLLRARQARSNPSPFNSGAKIDSRVTVNLKVNGFTAKMPLLSKNRWQFGSFAKSRQVRLVTWTRNRVFNYAFRWSGTVQTIISLFMICCGCFNRLLWHSSKSGNGLALPLLATSFIEIHNHVGVSVSIRCGCIKSQMPILPDPDKSDIDRCFSINCPTRSPPIASPSPSEN